MKLKIFLSTTILTTMLATSVVFAEEMQQNMSQDMMSEDMMSGDMMSEDMMSEDMMSDGKCKDMCKDMKQDMNQGTENPEESVINQNHYGVVTAISGTSITIQHQDHYMTFDISSAQYYDNETGAHTSNTAIQVGETVNVYGAEGVASAVITDVDTTDATTSAFIVLEATETPNQYTNAIADPTTDDMIYVMPEGSTVKEGDLVLVSYSMMTMSIPAYVTVESVQVIETTDTTETTVTTETEPVSDPHANHKM